MYFKKIINLFSRDSTKSYLEKVIDSSECKEYYFKTDSPFYRISENSTEITFIDPSGGPMIAKGSYLEEAKAFVEDIKRSKKGGYIIVLNNDLSSNKSTTTI